MLTPEGYKSRLTESKFDESFGDIWGCMYRKVLNIVVRHGWRGAEQIVQHL